ncbi:MAG: iron ABC transporter permease [Cutibacterium granulosum]|nr:iron ABC transporter permease [Cutibacterium granulosum]
MAPLVIILVVLIVVSAVFSLTIGSEPLPMRGVLDTVGARITGEPGSDSTIDLIVWDLRAPRALLAIIVGAGLALAGSGMQTLVRNPLADPYLLGVSAGASVGATAVIALGMFASWGPHRLTLGALVGALGAAGLVYLISMAQGGMTPLRLVLSGVVLSAAFSALASFLVFRSSDPRAAQSVLYWMLGSVAGATWDSLWVAAIVTALSAVLMIAFSGWLDALAAGTDVARSLGIPDTRVRKALFVGNSVLVGVLVAVSGGIGFVGLVIPHMSRLLVGASHRSMVPVAAAIGSLFLLWVDVGARVIAAPQEVPLGVVTGFIGAPIFLYLMGRSQYRFSSES